MGCVLSFKNAILPTQYMFAHWGGKGGYVGCFTKIRALKDLGRTWITITIFFSKDVKGRHIFLFSPTNRFSDIISGIKGGGANDGTRSSRRHRNFVQL